MTGPIRLLPDFLIIGGQRCGTTSLFNYMIEHPCIVSASTKEVHYFDTHYRRGVNWYKAHFPTVACRYYMTRVKQSECLTGEATPYYLFHPSAPKRICELIPRVKLIVLLRNPVDRAFSHHLHALRSKVETLPFEEALRREEERLKGEEEKIISDEEYYSFNHQHYSYLARGLYLRQIQNVLAYFPKDQLLVECSEELYAVPPKTLQRVYEFLNLSDWELDKYEKFYSAMDTMKEPLSPELRKRLVDHYRPHNQELYEFLGRRFDWDR
jgi:sulfotransferase family protein